jgi:D-alanyl-D-alanine carboxypeptidase
MTSANDAIQVIKEGVDQKYNADIFVRSMNENAQVLGLHDSHFANPQGFDSPDNYSSAADLATLSQYALSHYPLIDQIAKQDYVQLPANVDHKQFDLYNWNGLLDVYPGAEGIKIGNTGAAGYTTVVLANRENKKILVVVLGAPGVLERDLWASELLDLGYQQTMGLTAVDVTSDQLHEKYSTWKYWN